MVKQSNDKQKVIIIAALGIVMVGVGAFQFMGGSPKKNNAPAKSASAAAEETTAGTEGNTEETGVQTYPMLAQRDPFDGSTVIGMPVPPNDPSPSTAEAAEPEIRVGSNSGNSGGGRGPIHVPPMDPNNYGQFEGLPNVNGQNGSGVNPGINPGELQGGGDANVPSAPSMKVTGIVVGSSPMAVIDDGSGKQKTVSVGDRISGKRVTAIKEGKVILADVENPKSDKTTLILKRDAVK